MSGLTPEQIERLDVGVREWEDYGGPILNALLPVVAALIAEAVEQARAAAWDEGYTSGHSNAMRRMSDEPNAPTTPNPYRLAQDGPRPARLPCPVDGCPGDGAYSPPGRGHTCTTDGNLAALARPAQEGER